MHDSRNSPAARRKLQNPNILFVHVCAFVWDESISSSFPYGNIEVLDANVF